MEEKPPVLDLIRQVCLPMQVGDMAPGALQEGEEGEQRRAATK